MKKVRSVPSVSVIVPVFNQEKWLARCLRSLIDQNIKHSEYEIIVIDDGSTDRSRFVIEQFSDIVKIIDHSKNMGLPKAINTGIKNSRAKYIVRVDADDYVNINFIFLLKFFLNHNRSMDAIACDYYIINDREEIITRKNCMSEPIGCGILFKTSHLFEIGLYDEEFLLHEERELRIRFEKKYKIHHLELPLYRYRKHDDNITNNIKSLRIHEKKLKEKHK
jgi:glycosyltransferase involved in cell wall biosynthesis